MPDTIYTTGVVATPPDMTIVGNGLTRLTFRLAANQRKYNRATSEWENGETNWYTVVAFRRLAEHARDSVSKLDRVIVAGRLKVSNWEKEDRRGTSVEILADAIGHDLTFGTATFSRSAAAGSQGGPGQGGPEPAGQFGSGQLGAGQLGAEQLGSGQLGSAEFGPGEASASASASASPEVALVDADGWALPGATVDARAGDVRSAVDGGGRPNAEDGTELLLDDDEAQSSAGFDAVETPF